MKKIEEGSFEIFTSKDDAINKFIQLQGVCKDIKNSNDCGISFHCNKHGKIIIESLEDRYNPKKALILTKLYGEIIEQTNKTYINYYISLANKNVFLRLSIFVAAIVVLLILGIFIEDKLKVLIAIVICVIVLVFQCISIKNEKRDPSLNSKILIKVLEDKVNTINNWEK